MDSVTDQEEREAYNKDSAVNGNNHNKTGGFLGIVIGRKDNTVNNYCNIANGDSNNTSK